MGFFKRLFNKSKPDSGLNSTLEDQKFPEDVLKRLQAIDEIGIIRNDYYNKTTEYWDDEEAAYELNEIAKDLAFQFREKIKELSDYFGSIGDLKNRDKYANLYESKKVFDYGHYDCRIENAHLMNHYYLQAAEMGYPSSYNNIALNYWEEDKLEEAEQYFLKAINNENNADTYFIECIDGSENLALKNICQFYDKIGRFEDAEKYYLKSIAAGNNVNIGDLAIHYEEQGKVDLAEKYYIEAVPYDPTFHVNLAILYKRQERYDLAEQQYKMSIANGLYASYHHLGVLYGKQGKMDVAVENYLLAIEKGENATYSMYNLGLYYKSINNLEKAIFYYKGASDNDDVDAMYNLACLYDHLHNDTEAEKYYLKAIGLNHMKALKNYCICLQEQGRMEEHAKYHAIYLKRSK